MNTDFHAGAIDGLRRLQMMVEPVIARAPGSPANEVLLKVLDICDGLIEQYEFNITIDRILNADVAYRRAIES